MKKVKNGRLKILGSGSEKDNIKKYIKRENIRNVELCGFLKDNDLNQTVREFVFTVFPSEWYENSPMVKYESNILGKPVIGSNIGTIPELIIPNETGLFFEAGDSDDIAEKINFFIDNPDSTVKMSKNAKEFELENFVSQAEISNVEFLGYIGGPKRFSISKKSNVYDFPL